MCLRWREEWWVVWGEEWEVEWREEWREAVGCLECSAWRNQSFGTIENSSKYRVRPHLNTNFAVTY
jgi:hypothetical protein